MKKCQHLQVKCCTKLVKFRPAGKFGTPLFENECPALQITHPTWKIFDKTSKFSGHTVQILETVHKSSARTLPAPDANFTAALL